MNSQPSQGDFYNGYTATMSNSPAAGTRPGYATVGPSQAIGTGRRNQQGANNDGSAAAASTNYNLYADERFAPFETSRYERAPPVPSAQQTAFGMFPPASQQQSGWVYGNAGAAATMNGPINDGRVRQAGRRPALHSEWTSNNEQPLHNAQNSMPYYQQPQHLAGAPLGMSNSGSPDPFSVPPPTVNVQPYGTPEIRTFSDYKKDSDLIPTALVIKNIPFNVRKEHLAGMMIDMNLPQPYAFNYHFDQGVFRGLAFCNFQSPQDTAVVIQQMNGMEIQGRKLRVEYKKMLPEHERERIEREKREKRGQLEEQHRPVHHPSMSSLATATSVRRQAIENGNQAKPFDLNDPTTLRHYLDLYLFHNDDSREVLIFPADTVPEERRLIHILAHNMGLEHTSIGEGDNRQIHVSKAKFATGVRQPQVQPAGVTLDGHPRGLSRAATYDFAERQQTSVHSIGRGPTLAIPNSPDTAQHGGMNGLRGVKSFADLRSFSPSPSHSSAGAMAPPTNGHNSAGVQFMPHYTADSPFGPNSLATPTTPGSGINAPSGNTDANNIVNGLGSLSIGTSSFDGNGAGIPSRSRDTPGAIGSQRPGANGAGIRAIPERQPRGPAGDWGENSTGFTRGRSNGHMQRGSDSSDNTGRVGSSSLY